MIKSLSESESLNSKLREKAPKIFGMLSRTGKAAFFPKMGITAQSSEANGTAINATVGQALNDDGTAMVLDVFSKQLNLFTDCFLYAPNAGQLKLRKLWMAELQRKNPGLNGKYFSLPIVTSGITHGLSLVSELFVDNKDMVICPDLMWENYQLIFEQAKFDTFSAFTVNGFNLKGLEQALNKGNGKKIVILNFPNNPSGYTPTTDEAQKIIDILRKYVERGNPLIVICDDAYFGLFYDPNLEKESLFAKLADIHENLLAVKVDGLTKEAYVWGLRIGFVTYGFKGIDKDLAAVLENKTVGRIKRGISNCSNISQAMAINALMDKDLPKQDAVNARKLSERFTIVREVLKKHPEYNDLFEPLPFNSGYFMCVRLKKSRANTVRQRMLTDYNTGVISVGSNLIRLAYSGVPKSKLPELFSNLYSVCKSL